MPLSLRCLFCALTHDDRILHMVKRIAINLWGEIYLPRPQKYPWKHYWEIFRPADSAGGPVFALIIYHWYFTWTAACQSVLMLTAVHRWQWSFTIAKVQNANVASRRCYLCPGQFVWLLLHLLDSVPTCSIYTAKELGPLWVIWCVYIPEN